MKQHNCKFGQDNMHVCNGHHHGLLFAGRLEVSTPGAGCTVPKGSEIEKIVNQILC